MDKKIKETIKDAISPEVSKVTISLHNLTEPLPKNAKALLALWRECKDKLDAIELASKPIKARLHQIQSEIGEHLSVEEGYLQSETISVPNAAWVNKTRTVGVKVNDFDGFQRFCMRNNLEFVLKKQVNLAGVKEMYKMIMEGDLPEPKSAEFYTFDKITIRKR